jgi:hypothetical protein
MVASAVAASVGASVGASVITSVGSSVITSVGASVAGACVSCGAHAVRIKAAMISVVKKIRNLFILFFSFFLSW